MKSVLQRVLAGTLMISGGAFILWTQWELTVAVLVVIAGSGLRVLERRHRKIKGAPENWAQCAERLTKSGFSVMKSMEAVALARSVCRASDQEDPGHVWTLLESLGTEEQNRAIREDSVRPRDIVPNVLAALRMLGGKVVLIMILLLPGCESPQEVILPYCPAEDIGEACDFSVTAEVVGSQWKVTLGETLEVREHYLDRGVQCVRTKTSCRRVSCFVGPANGLTRDEAIAFCTG